MRSQKGRDTVPEIRLRQQLWRRGLRYRVNAKLPAPLGRRTADLVFSGARIAVFVDGCFWHGCPLHGTWPKANSVWWREKIRANIERDRDTDERLEAAGWLVVRGWEHDDPSQLADRVEAAYRQRSSR